MPSRGKHRKRGTPRGRTLDNGADPYRLVRYSHIFSAAVREVLELSLLKHTTQIPLTLHQFQLLKLMVVNGKHQVGQVAHFLGVSAPAATKNIDKLEGLGLVQRSALKGDRRASLLSVSAKGRRLVRRYEELKADRLATILESFTSEEISRFVRLLQRFSIQLYQSEKPDNGACLRCSAYIEDHCPVGQVRGGCPYQDARSDGTREVEEAPTA